MQIMNKEIEIDLRINNIGKYLFTLRKLNNMTQEDLAVKCNISKTYISRLESSSKDIRLSTLSKLLEKGFDAKIIIKFKA